MKAEYWVESFTEQFGPTFQKHMENEKITRKRGPEWDLMMEDLMDRIAHDHYLKLAKRRSGFDQEETRNLLNIDHIFFDTSAYKKVKMGEWGPFTIPTCCVEHVQHTEAHKINYHLWKTLSVRSQMNILICYQPDSEHVNARIKEFTSIIQEGKLVNRGVELVVFIGNDEKVDKGWNEFFTVIIWKKDHFLALTDLEWAL